VNRIGVTRVTLKNSSRSRFTLPQLRQSTRRTSNSRYTHVSPQDRSPNLTNSSVVPTTLHPCAAAVCRFFDLRTRLTMRALGLPKIPRTVGCTRNPPNAYVSHNRCTRFLDVAIATPCEFFDYSHGFHGQSLCSLKPFQHKNQLTRLRDEPILLSTLIDSALWITLKEKSQ
jgi:hypothetical protein